MAAKKVRRDLTDLEYLVLGLCALEPQSGYSIISFFENGTSSYSASPGSIYPMLKRLEQQEIIIGELEMAHETRPRKIYALTAEGEALLDAWLVQVPRMRPYYQEREMAMWRFQFMADRLPVPDILLWLENYMDAVRISDAHVQLFGGGTLAALEEMGVATLHQQLTHEAMVMEINAVRTWLEVTHARLSGIVHQTGQYEAVADRSDT
jgi:DNA-binding PadR family transcriptional regulator